jgi:hypothetical protein
MLAAEENGASTISRVVNAMADRFCLQSNGTAVYPPFCQKLEHFTANARESRHDCCGPHSLLTRSIHDPDGRTALVMLCYSWTTRCSFIVERISRI